MASSTKARYPFSPDYAVPPGETLAEVIQSLGMTQAELALRTGLSGVSINRIIQDSQPITRDTANKLELVTGVPASFWNNLEAQYREQLARLDEQKQLEQDLDWLKTIPVRELIERKVIPNEKEKVALLRHALAFYGTSSVAAWHHYWETERIAARQSRAFQSDLGAVSAWIRLGEVEAQTIECQSFNEGRFTIALRKIRALTTQDPAQFVPRMRDECRDAGVALCLIREMPRASWYGASKWLTPTKAMILLNLRGKREDQFWFSFFHEAGHILNDSKKGLFINDGSDEDVREQKANEFASTLLVPPEYRDKVKALRTKAEVLSLAGTLGISPGILVGHYHHITKKFDWFNDLRRKLDWVPQA